MARLLKCVNNYMYMYMNGRTIARYLRYEYMYSYTQIREYWKHAHLQRSLHLKSYPIVVTGGFENTLKVETCLSDNPRLKIPAQTRRPGKRRASCCCFQSTRDDQDIWTNA